LSSTLGCGPGGKAAAVPQSASMKAAERIGIDPSLCDEARDRDNLAQSSALVVSSSPTVISLMYELERGRDRVLDKRYPVDCRRSASTG